MKYTFSTHPSALAKFLAASIMAFVMLVTCAAFTAEAAINRELNYQGKLNDSSNVAVADGTYNMEFKLYTVSSGGSPIWTETRTSADKVQVTSGLFSVRLGDVASLDGIDFNQTLYLGVNIGGTGSPSWDGEMTPRKKLGTVPTAIVAETLNGLFSHQFIRNDAINSTSSAVTFLKVEQAGAGSIAEFVGTGSTTALVIKSDGKVGIGTTTPGQSLAVAGSMRLTGAFFDSANASGTTGMILQTTGTGTQWVATSSLGISVAPTTINGASGPTFTFGSSTTGTDFSISTSTGTVTFNIPTASATNRGLLAAADYLRIPSSASSTEWASFFGAPSTRITAGTGLSWTGNTLNASGNAAFTIASSKIYNATSTDLVGIGTSSPTTTLFVQGKAGTNPFAIASSTGTQMLTLTQTGFLSVGSSTPYAALTVVNASSTADFLRITDSGGATRFIIKNNENVGIGNGAANPGSTLHVGGRAQFGLNGGGSDVYVFSGNSQNQGVGWNVPIIGNVASTTSANNLPRVATTSGVTVGAAITFSYGTTSTNANNGAFNVWTGEGPGGTELTNRLSITSLGNVGIGTTTPGQKLDIWGNLNVATSSTSVLFVNTASGFVGIGTSSPTTTLFVQGKAGTNPFAIASSTGTQMLTLLQNGNLGIGTTTPSAALSVAGEAMAVNFTGTGSATSTFNGVINAPGISFRGFTPLGGSSVYDGIEMQSATQMYINQGGTTAIKIFNGNVRLNTGTVQIGGSGVEATLVGALNTLEMRNAASAQTFRVYNTYTSGTNYERGTFSWSNNALRIGTENSVGSARNLEFITASTTRMTIDSNGNVGIGTSTPATVLLVQGRGGIDPFAIASSTGSQMFAIDQSGALLINGSSGLATQLLQSNGPGAMPSWVNPGGSTNYLLLGSGFVYTSTSTDYFKSAYFVATSTTAASTFVNASTTNLTISGTFFLPGVSNGCVQVTGGVATSTGSNCGGGGSGNSAFTIANGKIYNATSTDLVGIGTSSPTTTLFVQGKAGTNPFAIASSTGTQMLTLTQAGNVGIGTSTPTARLSITGTGTSTAVIVALSDSDGDTVFSVSDNGSTNIRTASSSALSLTQLGTGDFITLKNHLPGANSLTLKSNPNELATVITPKSMLEIRGRRSPVWNAKTAWDSPSVGGGGNSPTPAFADLDNDGDLDLLIGENNSFPRAFENIGTASNPSWSAKTAWDGPNAGTTPRPVLADMDNDGDYDLLIGESGGVVKAYENTGSASGGPVWTARSGWDTPDVGANAMPSVADLDNDGDYDLLIGEFNGVSYGYENTGTVFAPAWTAKTSWDTPNPGLLAVPSLADLDSDGDYDVIIGRSGAYPAGYENTGSSTGPIWTANTAFDVSNAGSAVYTSIADIDNDGDLDVFMGVSGIAKAYENVGSSSSAFFANGRLGIGTDAPAEKLHVAGNILIGKRTDSAGAWTKRSDTTAGTMTSGGTASIGTTTAMAVFNGSLYAGTSKANGAEVYRYNGSTWTRVSGGTPGSIAGAGASNIDRIASMTVWNGQLYAGTAETGAAEVYRYNGNSAWTRISSSTAGAIGGNSTTTAIDSISAMTVNGGNLYIGTTKANSAEIARYNGPGLPTAHSWTKVNNIPANAGTIGATTNVDAVTVLFSYQSYLYAGTSEAGSSGALYRYDGQGASGTGFTIVGAAGTFSGTSPGGLSTLTAVGTIKTAAVYDGRVYLGIDDGAGTARVVKWDGNMTAGGNYEIVSSTTAGVIAEDIGATTGIDKIGSMSIYNDDLYVGTIDSTGIGEVYKLDDAATWTKVSSSTSGTISTGGGAQTGSITGVFSMAVYNDDLWIGTEKAAASEVYSYNVTEGQSYNLEFEGASDDADAIQNGLTNKAFIQFQAEESAMSNAGNIATGKFVFSHGINTVTGAYDLAEDYPTDDDTLAPGDLVSLDTRRKGFVRRAQGKNDKDVIGIYSVNPALRLSQKEAVIEGAKAIPVALAGRVPVSVTLENGPIRIGDYLTSSMEPGKAAKASKPGRVIGRALGAYSGAEGEEPTVTVFIGAESVSWNDLQDAEADVTEIADEASAGDQNAIIEFVDTVNERVADVAFAILNKADNLNIVISNKLTALVASIQDLFAKNISILPNGSISLPSGENQIAGIGSFEVGSNDVFIPNSQIDENTIIYITPTSEVDSPLFIGKKEPGKGFHVRIKNVTATEVTFDWFFVKTYRPKGNPEQEVVTTVEGASSSTASTTITTISPDTATVTSGGEGQSEATDPEGVSSAGQGSDGNPDPGTVQTSEGEAGHVNPPGATPAEQTVADPAPSDASVSEATMAPVSDVAPAVSAPTESAPASME